MQTPRRVRTAGNRACEHAGFSRCGVTVGSRSRDVGSMETVQGVRSVQTHLRGGRLLRDPGPWGWLGGTEVPTPPARAAGRSGCRLLSKHEPGAGQACSKGRPGRVRGRPSAAPGGPPFRGATSHHGGGPEVCAPLPWPRRPRLCPRGSQHVPSGCQVFGGAGGSHPPLTRLDRAPEILRSHAPYFFVVKSKAPHWRPRSSRP